MEANIVLDVQVSTPVADLSGTTKLEDFQHGLFVVIMHDDRLLMRGNEFLVCRGRNVVVRSISHGGA